MRKILHSFLKRPVLRLVRWFTPTPDRDRIFSALTALRSKIADPSETHLTIPFDAHQDRFILFSDQHKGAKNGADDFAASEANYLAALAYYQEQGFHLIILGDAEELWENSLGQVIRHNKQSFAAESTFAVRDAFTKIFGNHDLEWRFNPLAKKELATIYGASVAIREGALLVSRIDGKQITLFCTHGHQGDAQSDGNFFSKFFISTIWAPFQSYLSINPNTPAYSHALKTVHNRMMYEWSAAQKDLILITGHTHQPVFESLTHQERIRRENQNDPAATSPVKPSYFNTGCCCYDDGDITGIEIAAGLIQLVKWKADGRTTTRIVLESATLKSIAAQLS